jgi:cobalt-zinc-cadmium efflux system membrane fusion protein
MEMQPKQKSVIEKLLVAERVFAAVVLLFIGCVLYARSSTESNAAPAPAESAADSAGAKPASVDLSNEQLKAIKIQTASMVEFPLQREAVGSIDFDEDMSVQVYTPYQGKIIAALKEIGDEVNKGDPLFTIDSPDLVQAESTLISATGVLNLTTKALKRAREVYESKGLAQKDLEQAISDQQTAEGALKAARSAVRVFGKTDEEVNAIVAKRQIDPVLVVPSPITGRITARNAQSGLLVQPGNAPAPYSVADISTMWLLADVSESDSPFLHVGQPVKAKVMAYPDRVFEGKISVTGATVDPNTHRVVVRSDIADPKHELRPGMSASFVIQIGDPVKSMAVPATGVVREGDGTMTVWVTKDRKHFDQKTVKVGLQNDGYDQILDGVKDGELVVADGAVFLSNMLLGDSSDDN